MSRGQCGGRRRDEKRTVWGRDEKRTVWRKEEG
jgi:hypothetical protein